MSNTNLIKIKRTVAPFGDNCTKSNVGCMKYLCLDYFRRLFSSPNYIICIRRHTVSSNIIVVLAELVAFTLFIHSPAIGTRSDKIDSLFCTQIDQSLRKVVERLFREAFDHEYLVLPIAYRTTHRFIFGLILDQYAVFYQWILPKKVATSFGCLLKQRRIVCNSNRNLAVNRCAESLLRKPPS